MIYHKNTKNKEGSSKRLTRIEKGVDVEKLRRGRRALGKRNATKRKNEVKLERKEKEGKKQNK